jgi:5'-nucleotidase
MILQISEGSSFAWRRTASGTSLQPGSVRIGGAPLDPARTYRVVTNGFLASGGDGFTAFRNNRPRTMVGTDLDAFEAYVAARSPLVAPAMGRIRVR